MNKDMKKGAAVIAAILAAALIAACSNPVVAGSSISPSMNVRSISGGEVPSLGVAANFAVFGGGAGITNQGTQTTIQGDIGTTGASTG